MTKLTARYKKKKTVKPRLFSWQINLTNETRTTHTLFTEHFKFQANWFRHERVLQHYLLRCQIEYENTSKIWQQVSPQFQTTIHGWSSEHPSSYITQSEECKVPAWGAKCQEFFHSNYEMLQLLYQHWLYQVRTFYPLDLLHFFSLEHNWT